MRYQYVVFSNRRRTQDKGVNGLRIINGGYTLNRERVDAPLFTSADSFRARTGMISTADLRVNVLCLVFMLFIVLLHSCLFWPICPSFSKETRWRRYQEEVIKFV